MTITELVKLSYEASCERGFHPTPDSTFPERIALIHSEASEALEEFRDGHPPDEIYFQGDKPDGVPIELADVVIRIADLCGTHGIDLEAAIALKMKYNATRPYRHGGKVL